MGDDPKMSLQTLTLLSFMLSSPEGEFYGRQLGEQSGLSSGTLYPILNRLEKAKWLASRWENADPAVVKRPRRRLYRLTGVGQERAARALNQYMRQLQTPSAGLRPRGATA